MSVFYLFQFTIFRWNYQLTFHKKGEILEHVLLTSKGNYTKMKLVSAVQSLFCFTKLLNEYVITAENPSGFFFSEWKTSSELCSAMEDGKILKSLTHGKFLEN